MDDPAHQFVVVSAFEGHWTVYAVTMSFDPTPTRVELGCGDNKRKASSGIDSRYVPGVDLAMDIETEPLPFPDDSVEYVYSSHVLEHLDKSDFKTTGKFSPQHTMREIMRVCKHNAVVEIWTPYGKSNDAFIFTHRTFFTETHWHRICYVNPDFWVERGNGGHFVWQSTRYGPDARHPRTAGSAAYSI